MYTELLAQEEHSRNIAPISVPGPQQRKEPEQLEKLSIWPEYKVLASPAHILCLIYNLQKQQHEAEVQTLPERLAAAVAADAPAPGAPAEVVEEPLRVGRLKRLSLRAFIGC